MNKAKRILAIAILAAVASLGVQTVSADGPTEIPGLTGPTEIPGRTGPTEIPGLTGPTEIPGLAGVFVSIFDSIV